MATRDELYAKFGITAEAAQLFELELGTLILGLRGLQNGWHVVVGAEASREALDDIDRSTLGRLLSTLRQHATLEADLDSRFASALQARNRLIHGFFETHNFMIQTDADRDEMIDDLEVLHEELFAAWQLASGATTILTDILVEQRLQAR